MKNPFYNSLTEQEMKIVNKYRQLVGKGNVGVCSLKQNPFTRDTGARFAHYCTGTVMHCVTKNVGLQWVVGINPERWLTPREILLAQGFPVHNNMYGHERHSFSKPRARSRNAMFTQSGNSMPVLMSGLFFLCAVINVERSCLVSLLTDVRSAKNQRLG